MKLVIQRVTSANVTVNNNIVGEIGKGFLVLVGFTHSDTTQNADYLAKKLCNLRVFEDENGKMNLNLNQVNGKLLIVPQFTLYGNCLDGNRPDFIQSAKPEIANNLYEYFCKKCEQFDIPVEKGIFRADMKVSLLNDGPVTLIIEK